MNRLLKPLVLGAMLSVSAAALANQNAGFFAGLDGGAANYQWPSSGAGGNNGNLFNGEEILTSSATQNSFTGDAGAFLGYTFPVSSRIAIAPMVGYQYIGQFKQSQSVTTDLPRTINDFQESNFTTNLVDFLVAAGYQLTRAANFFVEGGAAVTIVNYNIFSYDNPRDSARSTAVNFSPELGLGVGLAMTQRSEFFVKYDYLVSNGVSSIDQSLSPSIGMVNAGFAVRF